MSFTELDRTGRWKWVRGVVSPMMEEWLSEGSDRVGAEPGLCTAVRKLPGWIGRCRLVLAATFEKGNVVVWRIEL